MRIKLLISYDGTNLNGWQVQPNGNTVQQALESAVEQVTCEKVRVTGSGRTDAGVHAKGQVAHFDTDTTIPPERIFKALNVHLPSDIRVLSSERVDEAFNACRTAKKKTYSYTFYASKVELPLEERFKVRIDEMPDLERMRRGGEILKGTHDFKGFCASGSGAKTTERTIYSIEVVAENNIVKILVTGNGFLYNMVRIIAGTLIDLGQGRTSEEQIREMLETGKRSLGGKTLLAKGLCLEKVEY